MKRCFYLTVILLFNSTEVFARAGGGSGSGGGYGNIIIVIFIIIFFSLLAYRTRQSKKQIKISEERDPAWDYDKLTEYTENVFVRLQDAWTKKDLTLVDDVITENLKTDFEKKIKHLNFINETNYLEDIEIKSIKIIGCEDYTDNEKDSFTAYIHGTMIDYSVSGLTGNITTNSRKHNEKFSDLYYFKRHINNWRLDRVENKVELRALIKAKHIMQ